MACLVAAVGCTGRDERAIPDSKLPPSERSAASADSQQRPAAETILNRLTAHYREAPHYVAEAVYRERYLRRSDPSATEPPPHVIAVAFVRPDRLRITRQTPAVHSGAVEMTMVIGERLLAETTEHTDKLLDRPAPDKLSHESISESAQLVAGLLPVPLENLYPQIDLLVSKPGGGPRLQEASEATLLDDDEIDGAACYRVRLDRPTGKHVLWIDKEAPVLRRLEMPTDEVRRQLDPSGELSQLDLWIDFRGATLDSPPSDDRFLIEAGEREVVASFRAAETNRAITTTEPETP